MARRHERRCGLLTILAATLLTTGGAWAQTPAALAQERAHFADWLRTAPNSPLRARALVAIGRELRIGPGESPVPLPGVDATVREVSGTITVEAGDTRRVLPRGRPLPLGPATLLAGGQPGQSVLAVFSGEPLDKTPSYYPYDAGLVFTGPLQATDPTPRDILALDGFAVTATEVGSVTVPDSLGATRLHVYRIPDPGSEESDLVIYFRDATNNNGSYPAGRFVSLIPQGDGRYRLDFNRARNPFCAYNPAYPCPAPWPGNRLRRAIPAGERYAGGGLD